MAIFCKHPSITPDVINLFVRLSVCLSVRLSVTLVDCVYMDQRTVEIVSPSDRPIILVCRDQKFSRKSHGFTPNRGAEYKGGRIFGPICSYISETVRDRGMVTIEDEYKVICVLSNSATFDDLE